VVTSILMPIDGCSSCVKFVRHQFGRSDIDSSKSGSLSKFLILTVITHTHTPWKSCRSCLSHSHPLRLWKFRDSQFLKCLASILAPILVS
jgi:hypothetical protein